MDYYQRINDDVRPSKRPRTLNETPIPTPTPTPTPTTLLFRPPTPQAISRNVSASVMFFKTRLCEKFSAGSCPFGDRCTFAHGVAELRPSIPNWEGMIGGVHQRGSSGPQPQPPPPNTTKICGCQSLGACERCTFRRVAEAEVAYVGLHHPHMDRNGTFSGPRNWPTPIHRKPCHEWQRVGHCKFGNRCIYSHQTAVAGIQRSGDRVELNRASGGVAPLRPIPEAADELEIEFEFENEPDPEPEPVSVRPVQGSGFQTLLRRKKIAGVYGDLIDEE